MDWAPLYPAFFRDTDTAAESAGDGGIGNARGVGTAAVEFLDVGCGYGGLLVALSTMFPYAPPFPRSSSTIVYL